MPRGQPKYQPTESDRNTVRSMAATGFTHEQIATCLGTAGIDPKTMRKHFSVELATAANKANAAVANKAYQMAVTGNPPAATFFWLKCRARWKETTRVEHTGKDGRPLVPVEAARALLEGAAASRPAEDDDEDPIKK
ncbi:MAG TPA: hypothetical protein VK752_10075 [Bryobacteraceae bacterium]|jgi:hypothetical protein|nr:hypothetical protein [Bryobacteraceae bacterium]